MAYINVSDVIFHFYELNKHNTIKFNTWSLDIK